MDKNTITTSNGSGAAHTVEYDELVGQNMALRAEVERLGTELTIALQSEDVERKLASEWHQRADTAERALAEERSLLDFLNGRAFAIRYTMPNEKLEFHIRVGDDLRDAIRAHRAALAAKL